MENALHQRVEFHMGTAITLAIPLSLEDPVRADVAFAACFARAAEIDQRFSPYRTDSEVTHFGRGEIDEVDLSQDMRIILDLSAKLHATTGGVFDIYATAKKPPACELQQGGSQHARPLDPSGVVKGWAIEQCADILRDNGLQNFVVNIGGDVYANGYESPEKRWRVGLQHPVLRDKIMDVLHISDTAVATSGLYERGEHIVGANDDITRELLSVTVVGADVTLADAYATSVFAMGMRGLDWFSTLNEFELFAVNAQQEVFTTQGIAKYRATTEAENQTS